MFIEPLCVKKNYKILEIVFISGDVNDINEIKFK